MKISLKDIYPFMLVFLYDTNKQKGFLTLRIKKFLWCTPVNGGRRAAVSSRLANKGDRVSPYFRTEKTKQKKLTKYCHLLICHSSGFTHDGWQTM